MSEKRLIALMNDYLMQMIERNSTAVFSAAPLTEMNHQERVQDLNVEITKLELEARSLIREQAKAGSELQIIYQEELAQIDVRLKNMKVTRDALQSKAVEGERTTAVQQTALHEIAQMSLEAFWNQESRYINQVLHRLMGKRRLVVLSGEIVGAVEVNRRQVRHV